MLNVALCVDEATIDLYKNATRYASYISWRVQNKIKSGCMPRKFKIKS